MTASEHSNLSSTSSHARPQPIIIGAGRGSRLKSLTRDQPKCYARIAGRSILDWALEAFEKAGLPTPIFIGGYQIDRIRQDYPGLTFAHNDHWPKNNILASLFYAEPHMEGGFVSAYSDILFRESLVDRAATHPGDIVLCVDTHWRDRYRHRTEHPEDDAEKVTLDGERITRVSRAIPAEEAAGEFIGVAKFSATGAARFQDYYHRARQAHRGRPWREAAVFEKAYLIMLFQEMIEQGEEVHFVTTEGEYMEIDTEEDYALANAQWTQRANLV